MAFQQSPVSLSGDFGGGAGLGAAVAERDGFDSDVLVIGGGLAGLTAAASAARAGASVVLLERASGVGGRAATHESGGFRFNVGPHALYNGGPAFRVFEELGVSFSGRRPAASGGLALHGGALRALPGGFVSLLTTDLLSLSGKLELGKVLGSLGSIDAGALRGKSLREWLDESFRDLVVRGLVESLMRVTSYANDPERSCAAAAVAQLQAGFGEGVLYLDGGWETLCRGLRDAATRAGASIRCSQRVSSLEAADDGVLVDLAGGSRLRSRTAILAVPPAVAASMLRGRGAEQLERWASQAIPVKAACLDLGLRRLPDPRRLFVVGIDAPLYFSVHSASARLAPEGSALVHVARYLGPDPRDARAVEGELERFCDLVQPGWREEVLERRYLPSMLVAGALVARDLERPGPEVPGLPSLLVAGDWVGREGMIADAAVASGKAAGSLAALRAAEQRQRLAAVA